MEQISFIKGFLDSFCYVSSQKVNLVKSKVFFSSNVEDGLREHIYCVARMGKANEIGMCLGVPMVQGQVSKLLFSLLLQKVESHLVGLKADLLLFVGRIMLAKSILSALPNHLMQSMYLPLLVCDEFDKMVRQFVWGDRYGNACMHFQSIGSISSGKPRTPRYSVIQES